MIWVILINLTLGGTICQSWQKLTKTIRIFALLCLLRTSLFSLHQFCKSLQLRVLKLLQPHLWPLEAILWFMAAEKSMWYHVWCVFCMADFPIKSMIFLQSYYKILVQVNCWAFIIRGTILMCWLCCCWGFGHQAKLCQLCSYFVTFGHFE